MKTLKTPAEIQCLADYCDKKDVDGSCLDCPSHKVVFVNLEGIKLFEKQIFEVTAAVDTADNIMEDTENGI